MQSRRIFIITILIVLALPFFTLNAYAEVLDIEFPLNGEYTILNNFGDPRSGGRTHEGDDILADKMTPIVSAVDGVVTHLTIPEASWGYAIYIRGADGYEYNYLHVNNDTPGTDDGNGGPEHAFVPGIERGTHVTRGQHIAWVGDSGNAENVGPHLHFEIINPENQPIDPNPSLLAALQKNHYDPAFAAAANPTINDDKHLAPVPTPPCESGRLIKSPEVSSVYYCGANGKRFVFPHEKVFFSWYKDFTNVKTITPEELAAIPLGGNVTYRPGVKLVKIQTDPKVYAVDTGGTLRWVTTPEAAINLYGKGWQKNVDDVADAFFVNYTVGKAINEVAL